ncbi:MAG: hypothetical protein ACOCRK_01225 [bacterium]
MKKKIMLFIMLITVVLLGGCMFKEHERVFKLSNPEPTKGALTYSNEDFLISFSSVYKEGIQINFENKLDSTMKVEWGEAVFVTPDNQASQAIPNKVSYIDVGDTINPTVIPGGANAEIYVFPEKNIDKGEAVIRDMEFNKEKTNTISVILPITIEDKLEEYKFDFEVFYRKIR